MKHLTAIIISLMLLLMPVSTFAESEIANESDLFFTQSEAGTDIDRSMHPVVWVFVALGVGAVVCVGVLMFINRRDSLRK